MAEFKHGDKVQHAQHEGAVLTYIGLSTHGKHVLEGDSGGIYQWATPPYPYVEPKAQAGEEYVRERMDGEKDRFIVTRTEGRTAYGYSRGPWSESKWTEDQILTSALGNYGWVKV